MKLKPLVPKIKPTKIRFENLPVEIITKILLIIPDKVFNHPDDICIKCLNLITVKACLTIIFDRKDSLYNVDEGLQRKIYVNFGMNVDRADFSEYVILNHNDVRVHLPMFAFLINSIQIWTADTSYNTYIYLYPFVIQHLHSIDDNCIKLSTEDSLSTLGNYSLNKQSEDAKRFKKYMEKYLKPVFLYVQSFFTNINDLELDMTFKCFKKIPKNITKFCKPKYLQIYLTWCRDNPRFFKLEWITDLFPLQKVERFTLHYLGETEFRYGDKLANELKNVYRLNLSFGKIDFQRILDNLNKRTNNKLFSFQVIIPKKFYNEQEDKINSRIWRKEICPEFVKVYTFK
ncbi:hypothetical protein KGF54_000540 [Candida jiufengensis]|uniref:uncharacterized protein n=1 Tax=Candida jiufengensis TaxID=497108 RepID=UPI0022257D43|nr:uncharacterized protein KGF54_000540 [Candida jiufengensis]KAI5956921.1 hypothetical protein KGF54_000540 [Candida jiufengensis]